MRELALFAGAGGGILGGRLLGWETVCAVESDPYCREVLLRRQRDGVLPMFPVWDDVTTFRGDNPGCSEVVEALGGMDDLVVTAGFPCQPYSAAGKRKGELDDRNLWPDTIRIIREVEPRFAFLENVPGLLRFDYFGEILGDLGEAGYDAEWDVVSAAEVGAPHLRKRLWIVCRNANRGEQSQERQVCRGTIADANGSGDVSDTERIRCDSPDKSQSRGDRKTASVTSLCGAGTGDGISAEHDRQSGEGSSIRDVADTEECRRREGGRGDLLASVRGYPDKAGHGAKPMLPTPSASMMTTGDLEQARYAGTDPKRPTYKQANSGTLNPDWVEWLMGWSIGWTSLRVLDVIEWRRWYYANAKEATRYETLRGLWWIDDPAAVEQRETGWNIQEPSVLLPPMLHGMDEKPDSTDKQRSTTKGTEDVSGVKMRTMRGEGKSSATSSGQKSDEQHKEECGDSLLEMPLSQSYIPRVTNEVEHRVDRLRAIGNGQVPLVAAVAFCRLAKRIDLRD